MKLHAYRLKNYRRLQDVVIELDDQISIFVGANNSGKTSAAQGLHTLLSGTKGRIQLFDFSAELWSEFERIGEAPAEETEAPGQLPRIALDLWFKVGPEDVALAMDLLPGSEWQGKFVGARVSFEPSNAEELVQRYRGLRKSVMDAATASKAMDDGYLPWPQNLTKYLTKELTNEYVFRYYLLDEEKFDSSFKENDSTYAPLPLSENPGGSSILKSLVKVDFLRAQRHLDDPEADGSARAENLSRRLSRFYQRNLQKRADDHSMLKALDNSEKGLNEHLENVFSSTLQRLAKLGYPGVKNPSIQIRASLDPTTVLSQDARVHYALPGELVAQLPDGYNGLGFKNLIYMVVELLDLHERWREDEANQTPLHLIFIEEPEAHLHAQIQQVFIRNVLELLDENKQDKEKEEKDRGFSSQIVVTTHSPHILYERGFSPIRYFRRVNEESAHHTNVKNLSAFMTSESNATGREFLQRYLKLTHCDLFFSDAAILVEGNVERLLLPAMIESSAPRLRSSALTILEVGGAFAHRFKELIEFIGLTTLVITDLDSVLSKGEDSEDDQAGEEDEGEDESALKTFEVVIEDEVDAKSGSKTKKKKVKGSTCFAHEPDALTANQTLISWIPQKRTIAELLSVPSADKVTEIAGTSGAAVRVAFQVPVNVMFGGVSEELCGRTLEEAFGLENAEWSQHKKNKSVGLRLRKAPNGPMDLAKGLHKKVIGKNFDKTKFALEVLASGPEGDWKVPKYIHEGLLWLQHKVAYEVEADVAIANASVGLEPQPGVVLEAALPSSELDNE